MITYCTSAARLLCEPNIYFTLFFLLDWKDDIWKYIQFNRQYFSLLMAHYHKKIKHFIKVREPRSVNSGTVFRLSFTLYKHSLQEQTFFFYVTLLQWKFQLFTGFVQRSWEARSSSRTLVNPCALLLKQTWTQNSLWLLIWLLSIHKKSYYHAFIHAVNQGYFLWLD